MNYEELTAEANLAFSSNDFSRALDSAKKAIQLSPHNKEAYVIAGKIAVECPAKNGASFNSIGIIMGLELARPILCLCILETSRIFLAVSLMLEKISGVMLE